MMPPPTSCSSCRDRLGVKPLFYQQTAEQEVLFGSEQKALFAGGITPAIQTDGWCEIWGLGPAHTPGHGVFHNMKEVLPGHYLTISGTQIRDHTYWQLEARPHADCYADTVHTVSALVQDSVKRQMVSDVPICTFLSGGLDSSLVSAICARELARPGPEAARPTPLILPITTKTFRPTAFSPPRTAPMWILW